jgi:xylose isomerase
MAGFRLQLRFSAGVWCFTPGGSRFHDRYSTPLDIPARLEIAAGLKDTGLVGIEAHYPNEINEENLEIWKQFTRDTGIRLVTIVPLLFFDADFEFGSLSSPIPQSRQKAIDRMKRTLELNREFGTDFAVVWPGIDGYENPFGIDFFAARDRLARGLAEAMDAVPGVRIAFEPKPYEPRGHILYGTTPEGILLGEKVEDLLEHETNLRLLSEGQAMVGMNPEVGHMQMAFEDLPYSFSLAMEYGRLFHTHWNSQPLGNYDQDQNVGVVSIEQTEAALYTLKMYGYQGYLGIDINPLRMPVEIALRNCMDALRAANDRIDDMDHEKVLWATEHPDRARGWLEAYLIRARAPRPDGFGPMPSLDI